MNQPSKNPEQIILSRQQVRQCDVVAMEKFSVSGLVLMENAGRGATDSILEFLDDPINMKIYILAGIGNNGGDGFVIARHLFNRGISVEVILCGPRDRIQGDALSNLVIIEKMGLAISSIDVDSLDNDIKQLNKKLLESQVSVIVDAMLGTGAKGSPRDPYCRVIKLINQVHSSSGKKVVALDIPSGLDCDSGLVEDIAIEADLTVTFAAMKKGFLVEQAKPYLGDIKVVSIGIDTSLLCKP